MKKIYKERLWFFLIPFNAINFYEALTEPNTAQATQGLARATKVQQVKNNAYYLERSDRGIQECNESRAEVGIRNRPTLQQKAVQTSSLHGKAQGPLRLHWDTEIAIYLAAFFFFFFFFLASPSSSSAAGAASSTGGASSFFSSSFWATKSPRTSLVLTM